LDYGGVFAANDPPRKSLNNPDTPLDTEHVGCIPPPVMTRLFVDERNAEQVWTRRVEHVAHKQNNVEARVHHFLRINGVPVLLARVEDIFFWIKTPGTVVLQNDVRTVLEIQILAASKMDHGLDKFF
jgi:hypothetical protein